MIQPLINYLGDSSLVTIIGSASLISFGLKVLNSFFKTFIRPAKNLRKLGKWAIITGATDGIGKAYAEALAKQGISVVLISRTEAKLKATAQAIGDKGYPGVETKIIVCDYSNFNKAARDNVEKVIKDLDIGILINNVGMSYPYPKYFHELSNDEALKIIELNVNSTTWMTKMVIGGMAKRKRGAILNVSSAAGLYTMPLLAQYSAAKGYIEKFSRGLAAEYKAQRITVQCQSPFYVATKLAKLRKSAMVPTPDEYVKLGLKWIGQGDVVVSPFWLHSIQGYVMKILPTMFVDKFVMGMHSAIRKKGMKKEAKKKAEAESKSK